MQFNRFLLLLISTSLGIFFLVPSQVVAQSADAAKVIQNRAELQAQLDALEKEINQQQALLDVRRNQRVSLERDIAILTAQIKQAQLSIKARNLVIKGLTEDIADKQDTIKVYSAKIDREKVALADLLRKIDEIEASSPIEVFLAQKSLSKLFEDVDNYDSVKLALRESYIQVGGDRKITEAEKATLEDKKDQQAQLLSLQTLEKKRLDQQQAEKNSILALTKGIEKEYQKVLAAKQESAATIRNALFSLQGSSAIPFEKAYEYAKEVERKLNVRAAFVLGIITEESNLGKNVGKGNWRVDMKAPRDTVPFIAICQALGLDPDKMPVSAKQWYGYGGAMGPAQFIPSTWVLYQDRIAKAVGKSIANPWDPHDAFMAAGLLLADNGANKGTRAAERLAAIRYLAGWANANKSAYAFYGNDVLSFADKYQAQIDILERS